MEDTSDKAISGLDRTRLSTPTAPPFYAGSSLVYDSSERRMLLFGGYEADQSTWALEWSSGATEEICDTAGDEDADGLADCADPDCRGTFCAADGMQCDEVGACSCPGGASEARCGDAWDDDCDGAIDCDDSDCDASAHCLAEADCTDGSDDDGDGLVDCADPGCTGVAYCEAVELSCGDGEDNDGDGRVDCQDVDCFLAPCPTVLP